MPGDMSWMKARFDELNEKSLLWEPPTLEGPNVPRCQMDGKPTIMLSANNYLNLTTHPKVVAAMQEATTKYGAGSGSVRAIAGTMDIHLEAEKKVAEFKGVEASLIYSAGYTVNVGLIPTLVSGPQDVIISDELNHGSIIDGVRLTKASRAVYAHNDMGELEAVLKAHESAERKLIITDGVFSMDGDIAKMNEICDLADKYDALVMTDECHSAGFIGKTGRGVPEYCGVLDRVDIITGTLGKALGGAMGGYTTGKKEIIEMLRQRSRPYLFSNSLAPSIVGAAIKVFDILSSTTELRDTLEENTNYFKEKIIAAGFDIKPGDSPIVPIMLYDAALSQKFADLLLEEGIYAIGFFYPVVPKEQARIRTQISAAHTKQDLDRAIAAFIKVGKQLSVID